jgi:hypothetical protein
MSAIDFHSTFICKGITKDNPDKRLGYRIGCPICRTLQLNKYHRLQNIIGLSIFAFIFSLPLICLVLFEYVDPSILLGLSIVFIVVMIPLIAVMGATEAIQTTRRW